MRRCGSLIRRNREGQQTGNKTAHDRHDLESIKGSGVFVGRARRIKDYRGRNRCCQRPPAQIRTWRIISYGSCLESSVKSLLGIWVDNPRTGEMTPGKALHPGPRPTTATTLTTVADDFQPQTSHLVHEATDAVTVARDGMIIQPALHNASQPTGRRSQRAVSPSGRCICLRSSALIFCRVARIRFVRQ